MPQNNYGSGREHAQFKTVRRLNSRNWCNIQASKGKLQFLQLLTEDSSGVVNPNVRYASDEALLTIDETVLGADTFYAEFELDNIDDAVGLSLLRFESVVDPCVAT